MNNVVTLKDCAEILKNRDNILILCHRSPDGDTIGSAFALLYALQKIGKKCMVDCSDTFAKKSLQNSVNELKNLRAKFFELL